jgi:hypothetical protein
MWRTVMGNKLIRFVLITLAALLILQACSFNGYQMVNRADYLQVRKNFDVTIGWNVAAKEATTTVEGYVLNNRYHLVQDLEIWIALLNSSGALQSRKSYFIIPTSLPQGDAASFSVEFPMAVKPGDRLTFLYRYKAHEDNEESLSWVDSFDVVLE